MSLYEKLADAIINDKPTPKGLWDKIICFDHKEYKEAYYKILKDKNKALIKSINE
jgi:hypothetical protein